MHVLGTPPAFILSQDQTLRLRGGNCFPLEFNLGFGSWLIALWDLPSNRVSVRKNCMLGLFLYSLLSIRFSRFCGAPLRAPTFRFHPKRKEIYYASPTLASRPIFEILEIFFQESSARSAREDRELHTTRREGGWAASCRRADNVVTALVLPTRRTLAYISIGSDRNTSTSR